MIVASMLAMAMVVYLFGGYADYERRHKNENTKS